MKEGGVDAGAPLLLSLIETARELGVSRSTLRRILDAPDCRLVEKRIGRRRLIVAESVRAFVVGS